MKKKYFSIMGTILLVSIIFSCKDSKTNDKESNTEVTELKDIPEVEESTVEFKKDLGDFIPKNYVPFDTIKGDLNKDGKEDIILIIKGTDKNKVIQHEYRGELDRNRRGIIALLQKNNGYELAVKNYDCFSSENEEGGVYYAPELDFEIKNGNLYVNYAHGRYGYWNYTFRYQNSDFELIGFDSSSSNGPVVDSDLSINFLTRTKVVNENINENAENEGEVFKKTVTKIRKNKLIKLSEIKDFDEFEFSKD
ncbi:hypothetical protein HNP37_000996 [Flavobacterium nitrogenifigens]|uniref:Lipoprotein n=2 Tax=Flavobacterium TaxID=237 RepID=A0A7W7N758_9FLAO|nr:MULTISPECIES: hypothetical protein [Flavobacterium]MBB4800957.1 hypothetical protein [Flavobacterium nitrogenifigens]MBB6385295.1 hypothetical protein [Flavobacterium notoginsengisoli]